jgi:hypothetical protein
VKLEFATVSKRDIHMESWSILEANTVRRDFQGTAAERRTLSDVRQGDGDGLFAEWRGRIEDEQQPFVT